MNFFKRAESVTLKNEFEHGDEEESLFLEDSPVKAGARQPVQVPTPPQEEGSHEESPEEELYMGVQSPLSRYNEDIGPVKRRKVDDPPALSRRTSSEGTKVRKGPFLDDSDEEDERVPNAPSKTTFKLEDEDDEAAILQIRRTPPTDLRLSNREDDEPPVPPLKREATSVGQVNEFDGIEDFIEDEFAEEGEEYLERRWMEEQAELELAMEDDEGEVDNEDTGVKKETSEETVTIMPQESLSTTCPICGGNTTGMAEQVSSMLPDRSTKLLIIYSKYLSM